MLDMGGETGGDTNQMLAPVQHHPCFGKQPFAGRGQDRVAALAAEKFDPKVVFKVRYLCADCRLSLAQRPSGGRERAAFGGGDKSLQLIQCDSHLSENQMVSNLVFREIQIESASSNNEESL